MIKRMNKIHNIVTVSVEDVMNLKLNPRLRKHLN